jgi:DHA1 family multidrug resistance protein-like MFS transporter
MRENRSYISLLLGVTFLYWLTLYLYVPTLPVYIKTKTINLSMVGLVLSMYGLLQLIFRLPVGIAVDSTGRGKPFIIGGLSFAALGAFIMGKGNSLWLLGGGRALTGISAATWVPLLVVFSGFFTPEETIFSSAMLTLTANLGRVLGTSLTGVINRAWGYQLPFYLAAIIGIIAVATMSLVREKRSSGGSMSIKSIASLFARRDVLLPAVISTIVHYADWSITFSFLPIFAQQLGASDVIKSVIISLYLASIIAGNFVNTLMLKRVRHTALLTAGSFIYFCGIMVIALPGTLSMIFVGTALMGFAFGIVYPILIGMSIQKVDRAQRNTAMGIHQSLYAVGMWTGPWLAGIVADLLGIRKMFMITGGVYLVLVYLFIFMLVKPGNSARNG